MRSDRVDIVRNYRTCEFTSLARDGSPRTWPVSPLLLGDGRFVLATSIGLPQKAFNIRRNSKVSLLFSEPTGSGIREPGAVLIQGDATAEDRIETDVMANPDLAAAAETVFARPRAVGCGDRRAGRVTNPGGGAGRGPHGPHRNAHPGPAGGEKTSVPPPARR